MDWLSLIASISIGLLAAVCLWAFRLRRDRDTAQRALAAKAGLLSKVSHDIRMPMNGIIGMNNLLLMSTLNGEQKGFAETVQTSAESLLAMLNNLLDYSRLDDKPVKLASVEFDLISVIEDVADHFAPLAHRKKLNLTYHMSRDMPHVVRGDPVRLRQVLENLMSNAVKFTDAGEVALLVRRVGSSADSVILHFDVMDTGVGIAPELHDRLLSPGREDLTGHNPHGGAGLGLAICRRVVEATGGCLDFQSQPGKGTTFFFLMSFGTAQELEPHLKPQPVLSGLRVRIAHSSTYVRRMLQAQCEQFGATVLHDDSAQPDIELREPAVRGDANAVEMIRAGELAVAQVSIPCRARNLAQQIRAQLSAPAGSAR